ncbi:MAG: ABC transporter substrate-binding protein, partial [Clostridia bacterium]
VLVLALALVVAMFAGCNGDKETENPDAQSQTEQPAENTDKIKIGIIQLVQHAALDAANEGFCAALEENGFDSSKVEIEQANASGDQANCQSIASSFVNDKKDLILAIATPAAQAVAAKTKDIPILVTAVTDPAESGLVASNDAPGGNVSGTSDMNPINEQMELITKIVPNAKKVAILYCSAEANSVLQANMAEAALKELGIEAVHKTVSQSNEIQQVVSSCVGEVDAIYTPTDNMMASGMATVAKVANDNKIPVICGESGMVESGGLITYGINYYNLGHMTGEMAVKYFNGEVVNVGDMPIEYLASEELEVSINWDTVEAIGIEIPEDIKALSTTQPE